MPLIELDDLRQRLQTDSPDARLTEIVNAIEKKMIEIAGPHSGDVTELIRTHWSDVIYLERAAQTVVSIEEFELYGGETQVLASSDYTQETSFKILRLSTGDNPRTRWPRFARVKYTVVDATDKRRQALVQLAKLQDDYSGKSRLESGVGIEVWYRNILKEEQIIYAQLKDTRIF